MYGVFKRLKFGELVFELAKTVNLTMWTPLFTVDRLIRPGRDRKRGGTQVGRIDFPKRVISSSL